MNVCVEYEALLDLYVDGELEAEEMAKVQEHLDSCPACRAYVDGLLAIRAEFPDEESIPLPEGFHASVMASVAADAAKSKKPSRRRYAMFAPLAAACLAVMVMVNNGGSAKKERAAPLAAPSTVQYSLTANEPAAAPAAEAPAAAEPAPAAECPMEPTADMETQYTADAIAEAEGYFITLTVTKEEAREHLAAFEAMEWNGQEAYELTAEEYAQLLFVLGREEEHIPTEGMALVIIQE